MLGLARGTVRLFDHNPHWSELFDQERQLIKKTFGASILNIQHVGSTSIPGIPAKPIIDLNVCVLSLEVAAGMIDGFETIEYEHRPFVLGLTKYGPEKQEEYFVKGPPDNRQYHVHVTVQGSDYSQDYMLFRDYLRQHPERAHEYAILKSKLAEEFSEEREKYTKGKSGFIYETLMMARA